MKSILAFEKSKPKFPHTSFLLAGVSHYTSIVQTIHIGDSLFMTFQPDNPHDSTAICIMKDGNICGYVPMKLKEKIAQHVPSHITVINKQLIKDDIYGIRVDIII